MKVNLFGHELNLRDFDCKFDENSPKSIEPYINLYVRLTNQCFADCKFCTYHNKVDETFFDFYKFYFIINKITQSGIRINKISFTGGEPTLCIDLLIKLLQEVKALDDKIFTVVNTNGFRLNELLLHCDFINSIALSRHHYDDGLNSLTFGRKKNYYDLNVLNNFKSLDKIHLSCNVIKGYIDNVDEVKKYLEFAGSLGISDVGFVNLMKVNDYCNENFIDFSEIDLSSLYNLHKTKTYCYEKNCKCSNYLYYTETPDSKVMKLYYRHVMKPSNECYNLVYDVNQLLDKFQGNLIL